MPKDSTEVIKQTKLAADTARKYKAEAALHDKRVKDLYGTAVEAFLQHRGKLAKSGEQVPYLVSPQDDGGREVNVTLPFSLMQKVVMAAEADGVSSRRLLYTALMHFSATRLK